MKMYHSNYQHLVVSGCSFTHNNHHSHCTWANSLAVWTGMSIDNLAIPGAGNTHVKNSTILHLEQNNLDPNTTLVLIMWSGPERIDWITDKNYSKFKDQYSFEYTYCNNNELVVGGNWWSNLDKETSTQTHLTKTLINYSKYQSASSLALNSWLQIQDLENYLKIHGYRYYFMSWFDYDDPIDNQNRWIALHQELKKLNLKIDQSQWLPLNQSLGSWAQVHPDLLCDSIHVGWQGHELWLKEVLIPVLLEKKVLYEFS